MLVSVVNLTKFSNESQAKAKTGNAPDILTFSGELLSECPHFDYLPAFFPSVHPY